MSNDWYNNSTYDLTTGEVAEATDVEGKFDEVVTAFDKLPSEERLKRGTINFIDDAGTTDALAVTLTYAPTEYVDGMEVVTRVKNSNTGACTINVNSLGAKSIKNLDGSNPAADQLKVGYIVKLVYDSDNDYFVHIDAIETINISSGILTWTVISTNTTAVAGNGYIVDTSSGAVTLTLPAAASVGDTVGVKDGGSSWDTNNLTIARNGLKIMALEEDMTVSTPNMTLELVYASAAKGWRV